MRDSLHSEDSQPSERARLGSVTSTGQTLLQQEVPGPRRGTVTLVVDFVCPLLSFSAFAVDLPGTESLCSQNLTLVKDVIISSELNSLDLK